MKMYDWQNREYDVEIVFTRMASDVAGYIIHIDDEPYLEGEMYPTKDAALRALRDAEFHQHRR